MFFWLNRWPSENQLGKFVAVCVTQTDVSLTLSPLLSNCHSSFWVDNQIKLGFGIQFNRIVECLLCDQHMLDIMSQYQCALCGEPTTWR